MKNPQLSHIATWWLVYFSQMFNVKYTVNYIIINRDTLNSSYMLAKCASKCIALACLSTKRLVLMNWKVRKPNCFNFNRWLEDFLNILSMEEAAFSLLYLVKPDNRLWDKIRAFLDSNHLGCQQ